MKEERSNMRIARILTKSGPKSVVFVDGSWAEVKDIFQSPISFTGESFPDSDIKFLAPVEPKVVVAMAHNGTRVDREQLPQAFLKSARTVRNPGDAILKDDSLGQLEVEGELTIVISKVSRNLTPENALQSILGFTIANDVTAPDQTPIDHLLTQSKNGDGYTPIGPWIETELQDFDNLPIRVHINGKLAVEGSTGNLARGVIEQLVYITRYMTLGPGDILLGGCPLSIHTVSVGDHVQIEIPGIGSLANPVATAQKN